MRTMRSLLSPLAVALLASAGSVEAQQFTVASNNTRSSAAAASTTDDAARTVAIYRFGRYTDASMPTEVTVSDSLGTLIASYRSANTSSLRPMTVEILNEGLLLQAETLSGVLTLFINQPTDRTSGSILIGTWILGGKSGELLRRTPR